MKDYYKILEVNQAASTEIISKVYKILAKKYHPDANPKNPAEAEEKFKEISEAYEILSNEEKRKIYDMELEEYEKQRSAENNPNYVPLEMFNKLQSYCKDLELSIAQLTAANSAPAFSQYYKFQNMSAEEIEQSLKELEYEKKQKLKELEYEKKQQKRANRIELIKNIALFIIMLLFILWTFIQP